MSSVTRIGKTEHEESKEKIECSFEHGLCAFQLQYKLCDCNGNNSVDGPF